MNRSIIGTRAHKTGAIAAAGLLTLSACSGSSDDDGYGDINVPLSWLHTAEFAGLYMAADNGHFADAGFDTVNLTPGGPSATPSPIQVAIGRGAVGMSNPMAVGSTISEEGDDAPLKIIGSVFQQNAYSIMAKSENAAASPHDLQGMRIGVAPANEPVFYAVLEANGLTAADVDVVSVQGGAQPLLSDEVDAYMGFATNELLSMELAGEDIESMMFAENGLPFAGGSIVVSEEMIEENREELKAFLEAAIRGWHDALANHEAVAETTVENHAADQNLDVEHQQLTSERQADLIINEWTQEHGLFTMSDELIEETLSAIGAVGYTVPDDLFDLTLVEEVYEENPELVEHP